MGPRPEYRGDRGYRLVQDVCGVSAVIDLIVSVIRKDLTVSHHGIHKVRRRRHRPGITWSIWYMLGIHS